MMDQAEKLRIMARNMRQQVEAEITGETTPTRIICISSGKGGVGKSSVTLNLGLALIEYGQRVLILDADMGMANIDLIMGKVAPYNLYHIIYGDKRLPEIIQEGPKGIRFISGGSGIAELANLSKEELDELVASLSSLDGTVDVLLVDTGAGVSHNVLAYLFAADELLVVTTPEPTAITDAYGLIKSVEARQPGKQISIIVNRVKNAEEAAAVSDKLLVAVRQFLHRDVHLLGFVPEDPLVSRAVRVQTPFFLLNERAPASRAMSRLAAGLCKLPVNLSLETGFSRLFSRMKSFFE
ncbi:MAG: MinD/ParA family protein [Heliobacteriaceae bacterium]|nr:MinD/ParA family protein [Heliobacteriaceae bacterium]MDD4587225.1 MinD/ParA family protein [Heliobacteriaceae bacterium]